MTAYRVEVCSLFGHLAIILGAFLLSLVATRAMERSAAAIGLTQPPNQRSSHTIPTPQGGGIVGAAIGVGACLILGLSGNGHFTAIAALAAVMAALGFLDDLYDLPAALRLGVQMCTLSAMALTLLPPAGFMLPFGMELAGWVLGVLIVLCGLWWINLFNFMDGIDGIAASQTVLILLAAVALGVIQDPELLTSPTTLTMMIVAATAAGFLLRNLPPARIFMGDAGSNFYAMIILALALLTMGVGALSPACWIALCAVFVTDASVTLVRRAIQGERPWHAHRRHAYQQLSRRWGHGRVTLVYAALTLFWATPMAGLTLFLSHADGPVLILTFTPLVILAFKAGAGAAAET